jgi:hypothetical protein
MRSGLSEQVSGSPRLWAITGSGRKGNQSGGRRHMSEVVKKRRGYVSPGRSHFGGTAVSPGGEPAPGTGRFRQAGATTASTEHMYHKTRSRHTMVGWMRTERTRSSTVTSSRRVMPESIAARLSKMPSTNISLSSSIEVCAEKDRPSSDSCRYPTRIHALVVTDPQYGIHPPGPYHQGQVVSAAPWRALSLTGLGSGRCGPPGTSSPPSAAQHWRPSNAMSRTSPKRRPRPLPHHG